VLGSRLALFSTLSFAIVFGSRRGKQTFIFEWSVTEHYTSMTCGLHDRSLGASKTFECGSCGSTFDRDVNAMRNMLVSSFLARRKFKIKADLQLYNAFRQARYCLKFGIKKRALPRYTLLPTKERTISLEDYDILIW
jgi:hypothetical protein